MIGRQRNFSRAFMGPVTVSEALRDSLNTIAATLAQETSVESVISIARKFGISEDFQPFPSIALGSQEVTLWDLTARLRTVHDGRATRRPVFN